MSSLVSDARFAHFRPADRRQGFRPRRRTVWLSPLEVVVTKKDGKTEDLLVGDDTPTGGGTFVKLKNDPRVFSVSSGVKSSLDKIFERPAGQAAADFRFRQADARRVAGQGAERRVRQEQSERMADPEAQASARRRLAGGRAGPQAEGRQDGYRGVRRRRQESGGGVRGRERRSAWPRVSDSAGTQTHRSAQGQGQELLRQKFGGRGHLQSSRTTWATGWTRTSTHFATRSCSILASTIRPRSRSTRPPTRKAARNGWPAASRWIRLPFRQWSTSCGTWPPPSSSIAARVRPPSKSRHFE